MNITNTILTTTAVEQTGQANYILEYTEVNGKLGRIQATIRETPFDENTEPAYIGSIYMEEGNLSCNFPSSFGMKVAPYFADFDMFVEKIQESRNPEGAV